jgi:hypothetical protein
MTIRFPLRLCCDLTTWARAGAARAGAARTGGGTGGGTGAGGTGITDHMSSRTSPP